MWRVWAHSPRQAARAHSSERPNVRAQALSHSCGVRLRSFVERAPNPLHRIPHAFSGLHHVAHTPVWRLCSARARRTAFPIVAANPNCWRALRSSRSATATHCALVCVSCMTSCARCGVDRSTCGLHIWQSSSGSSRLCSAKTPSRPNCLSYAKRILVSCMSWSGRNGRVLQARSYDSQPARFSWLAFFNTDPCFYRTMARARRVANASGSHHAAQCACRTHLQLEAPLCGSTSDHRPPGRGQDGISPQFPGPASSAPPGAAASAGEPACENNHGPDLPWTRTEAAARRLSPGHPSIKSARPVRGCCIEAGSPHRAAPSHRGPGELRVGRSHRSRCPPLALRAPSQAA